MTVHQSLHAGSSSGIPTPAFVDLSDGDHNINLEAPFLFLTPQNPLDRVAVEDEGPPQEPKVELKVDYNQIFF